jgi:hypothetical protein
VEVNIPLTEGYSLTMGGQSRDPSAYPSGRLQRGLLLLHGTNDLAEEGVGFGVPILKRGALTIFPGGLETTCQRREAVWEVTATFEMDLVERLAKADGDHLRSRPLYTVRDALAALHRRAPALRGPLTATSNALRRACGWVTTFEKATTGASVRVTSTVDSLNGRIRVAVEAAGLPAGFSEMVVMNELGAQHFDRYRDSDGARLVGRQIGTWDEVTAAEASFVSRTHGVAFSLGQIQGARLYRGRERVGSRLAWSGFGYSLAPPPATARYDLRIVRTA